MREGIWALVTGATGGLGEELCREFARHGYNLVITARDPQGLELVRRRLTRTYGVEVEAVPADLNQDSAPKRLYQRVREAAIPVSVLVNNAGFGHGGYFFHNPPRIQDAMIRVNVMATTRLCRFFLPDMLGRGVGGILNVASAGSCAPGSMNAIYAATKAYVLSLTQALADEMRDTPILVSALCPGAMHTGYADRANMESTRLYCWSCASPKTVARHAYRAFHRGRRIILPDWRGAFYYHASRLSPYRLSAKAFGMLQRQRARQGE